MDGVVNLLNKCQGAIGSPQRAIGFHLITLPESRTACANVSAIRANMAKLPGAVGVRLRNQRLPGGRYATAALEALSIIALNSAPVQALPVLTSKRCPPPPLPLTRR